MLLRLVKTFHQWRPKQNNPTLFEKIFIRINLKITRNMNLFSIQLTVYSQS